MHFRWVKDKGDLAPGKEPWTRPDEYMGSLARRRTARRSRGDEVRPRTQPEAPRFSLSTLPFLVLFGALLLIAVGIMIAAWPGGRLGSRPTPASRQLGTAEKGWFQEAQKQFHR